MEFQVVVEYDPESRHSTATVLALPQIVVDARTQAAALKLAKEAIAFALDEDPKLRSAAAKRKAPRAKVLSVEI